MSGTEKPSQNISNEVEISLEIDETPQIIIPKRVVKEPEYYECDEKYTTFE